MVREARYRHPMAQETLSATQPSSRAISRGQAPIRVAIVGATGYAGGELARLLLRHPEARLVAAGAHAITATAKTATPSFITPEIRYEGAASSSRR